jgi:hypothetical protein
MPRQPVQTYNHKIHFNTNYVPVSKLQCFNKMYTQNSGYISTFNNSLHCKISDSHGGEYKDVFKDVVSCSPVEIGRLYRSALTASIIIALMMEGVSTSET